MPIVTLPVFFRANIREKGHRTWYERDFRTTHDFVLPEISAEECPIAAQDIPGAPGGVRWDGKTFWVADGPTVPEAALADWCEGVMKAKGQSRAWEKFLAQMTTSRYGNPEKAPELNPDQYRDKRGDTLEASVERHADFLSGLAVIDGVVHRPCGTPLYRITSKQGEAKADIVFGRVTSLSFEHFFELNRREDMLEQLEAMGGTPDGLPDPWVIIEDAFRYPDELHTLRIAAKSLVKNTEHRLAELPDETGEAWFRLRAAQRALEDDRENATLGEALAARFEELLATLPPGQEEAVLREHKHVRLAVERWNMRPIDSALTF